MSTGSSHDCAAHFQVVERVRDFPIHGTTVSVREELFRCALCGEEEYSFEQAVAAERRASELYREKNGFLQPDEIAALRRRWGLSQARLEDALGVGRKTVARWEAGRVLQSRALDNLLRAIDRFPAVLTFLSEQQGVGVQPSVAGAGHGEPAGAGLTIPKTLRARLEREANHEGVSVDVYAASVLAEGLERRSANRQIEGLSRKLNEVLESASRWATEVLRVETEEPWLRDHQHLQRNSGDKGFAL
jgi:HTH-type transcriptional regulator/antitoxin MqsA